MSNAALQQDSTVLLELMLRQIGGAETMAGIASQLMAAATEMYFHKGETLYQAGNPAQRVFFMVDGAVRLQHEHEKPWLIEAPGIVGLLDAELDRPHYRTAIADKDCHAFAAPLDDYFDIVQANFGLIITRVAGMSEHMFALGEQDGHSALLREPSSVARCHPDPASGVCVPGAMERPLNPFERLLMLRLCPLLQRCGMQALSRLAELARERTLQPGEVLYRRGEPMTHVYVVVHGQLEWHDEAGHPVARFGPPEPVGGYVVAGLANYPMLAVARTPARLLSLAVGDLFDVMEDHFDASRAVMAYLLGWMETLRERAEGRGSPPSAPRSR